MKLFYQFEKPDPEKIIEGVKKAYGVKNPGKINGFIMLFCRIIPFVILFVI